jgi:hypothetical protein
MDKSFSDSQIEQAFNNFDVFKKGYIKSTEVGLALEFLGV